MYAVNNVWKTFVHKRISLQKLDGTNNYSSEEQFTTRKSQVAKISFGTGNW